MQLLFDAATKTHTTPNLVGPAVKGVEHGLVHDLAVFWWLWVLIGAVAGGKLAWRLHQLRRLARSGIKDIDQMDGHRFEEFLVTLFRRLGYKVELSAGRRHGDYGCDLVVAKGRHRTAVQAKRWSKNVGVKAVQEAAASKNLYHCDRALVVANQEFTAQARKLARANDVELWGREVLVSKLLAVRGQSQPEAAREPPAGRQGKLAAELQVTRPVPAAAGSEAAAGGLALAALAHQETGVKVSSPTPRPATTKGSPEPGRCAACGNVVSEKVRDYCMARPERFSGNIYCFDHQRSVRGRR